MNMIVQTYKINGKQVQEHFVHECFEKWLTLETKGGGILRHYPGQHSETQAKHEKCFSLIFAFGVVI